MGVKKIKIIIFLKLRNLFKKKKKKKKEKKFTLMSHQ